MIFTILLATVFTAFAFLAWRDLKLALILLCGLTPTYLVRFTVGPVPSTMLEGFLMVVTIIFFVKHQKSLSYLNPLPHTLLARLRLVGRLGRGRVSVLTFSIALIGLASITAVIIAPNTLSALGIWKAYYVEPFIFGLIILKLFDRDDYRKAFLALGASGTVIALFAIVQVLFHVGIPDAWATENRATSFFPYPNAVGLLLAPMVSAGIMYAFSQTTPGHSFKRRGVPVQALPIVLLLVAIGLAKTEAALVAIPAALYVVAMMTPVISKRKKMLATSGMLIALAGIFMFLPQVAAKLTLHDTSGLVRRAQWSETLHLLADHPYLGVGLNGYPIALVPYHDATAYEIFQYPHNVFLNVWSELGILGLLGFLGLILFASRFAWQHRHDPWTLACFAALLTMLIHGLVDVPFMKNDLAIVSVLMCIAMTKGETK